LVALICADFYSYAEPQIVISDPSMKKTFKHTDPKITYARWLDAVKSEVAKYMKRERRKKLPEGVDFWDFDCKWGESEAAAVAIHPAEMRKSIDASGAQALESFYLEILAKPGHRTKKPKDETADEVVIEEV
jgi:hypothetical protein